MADTASLRYAHHAAWSGLLFGVVLSLLTGFAVVTSLVLSATWWVGAWALHGVRRDLLSPGHEDDRGR